MNKERIGEIRFGDEINENIIEVTPNEEEAVNLENSEAVFQALNSEDPLKTLDVLFEFTKEPENCELFIEALPLFLKTFDALSKNENPKISDLGKRIIVNLYTVTSGTELVRPQQAAYEFLMSIGTPENEDFPLFISLLLTLVSRSITIKQYMMKIGLLDMFVAIDPSTVPGDSLLEYTKIITYFLLLASNMSASTRLDLMDRLRLLIANCEDPQITNECLNAIDRVTNDVANTSSFISSETFNC